MTERKPRSMSVNTWVEGQIRRAEAQGEFRDLAGAGKPLPNLDREQDPLTWVVNKLRAEKFDLTAVLPPQLALAREVELLPDKLTGLPSQSAVLAYLTDLNRRITQAHARPAEGPPMRTKLVDVEASLEQWRGYRAARLAAARTTSPTAPPRRSGWRRAFGRSRRRSDG